MTRDTLVIDTRATPQQLDLLRRCVRSHLIHDDERGWIHGWIKEGLTIDEASELVDHVLTLLELRRNSERVREIVEAAPDD